MSNSPPKSQKRNRHSQLNKTVQNNNNSKSRLSSCQQAWTFITWYKHMIDHERENLTLYLSDDAMLEWFGRTIKTRKKVTAFLKYDMHCSRHDFTTVERIEKVQFRVEIQARKHDTVLASPLNSPEIINHCQKSGTKRALRSNCNSPEWADGCQPQEELHIERTKLLRNTRKRLKFVEEPCNIDQKYNDNGLKRQLSDDDGLLQSNGDGMQRLKKRKCASITPPNLELGQGDCLPSTSGTDSEKSHDTLNAQLPKLAVECKGYIEFTRTRNNRSTDAMKWERKCKVQISYSEDPLNIGEYIIWAIRYTDESKCRRNLLAAFNEVANKELNKNSAT